MTSKFQNNNIISMYQNHKLKRRFPHITPTLSNPNILVRDFKAIVSAGGHSETFDLSYVENTGHENYNSCKVLYDEDGNSYYLALLNQGDSQFRINGLVPDNGGWFSDTDIKGGEYDLGRNPAPSYNNWNFSYTVKNTNVYEKLINDALYNLNTALPALNVHVDPNSTNEVVMGNFGDSWSGMTYRNVGHFKIELNSYIMEDYHGPYLTTSRQNNWLAVTLHEFGHTLGLRDNASHKPTVYDYDRDGSKCVWLQPNDIYALKHLYKVTYNLDISGTQEEINAQIPNITNPATASTAEADYDFIYDYHGLNELEQRSDVIVKAKLKYKGTEDIDIGLKNDSLVLNYNIYDMIVEYVEKGDLINKELKIHSSQKIDIDENCSYKLYLKQYENLPCSLINMDQGIMII